MTKRIHRSIDPFPSEIDENRFGDYLSGLVDGEGHFAAFMYVDKWKGFNRTKAKVYFTLSLRADDLQVLLLMQSYFGCGKLDFKKQYSENHNDQVTFSVSKAEDLVRRIIPHFINHPLYAKKGKEFLIWKEAVEFVYEVAQIKMKRRAKSNSGKEPKWTPERLDKFKRLVIELKAQREYKISVKEELLGGHETGELVKVSDQVWPVRSLEVDSEEVGRVLEI